MLKDITKMNAKDKEEIVKKFWGFTGDKDPQQTTFACDGIKVECTTYEQYVWGKFQVSLETITDSVALAGKETTAQILGTLFLDCLEQYANTHNKTEI